MTKIPLNNQIWLSFVLLILSSHAYALTQAHDLLVDSQHAKKNNMVIMILFTEDHCPYCHLAKQEAIVPISRLKQYQQKVIVREINTSNNDPINGINGQTTSADLRNKYQVNFYPTVVFLNYNGRQLTQNVIGFNNKEFYWYTIDNALQLAYQQLTQ